ncbi:MAG TPA: GNAT family N-acetyltransferase [Streptosporangiaceae bacterium]|jgi:predicted GNAT family acetyltransferase|nr:GNAT family N-acetyltransferase [Streptosporangiaceae bacterium]
MELRVADNPEKARYVVLADGDLAGFVQYELTQNAIAFTHTQTDARFRGRGIAGHLVRAALDSARERGLGVLPYCPFVRAWIGEHPDYADLVPADRRAEFDL